MSIRDWAVQQLAKHTEIYSAVPHGDFFVAIERKKYEPFSCAILNERRVEEQTVEWMLSLGIETQFITNMPKKGVWTGPAISVVREYDLGWGGFGDLMSAINHEDVRGFQKKEFSFVERGLSQHDRVSHYERIFDRVFDVFRWDLRKIRVTLPYEYDVTAEHVRQAREVYGDFDVVVKTNPNGGVTENARGVGGELGVEILKWGQFLGRLNRA